MKGATRMIGLDENPEGKTRAAKGSKIDDTPQTSSLAGNISRDSARAHEEEESFGKGNGRFHPKRLPPRRAHLGTTHESETGRRSRGRDVTSAATH